MHVMVKTIRTSETDVMPSATQRPWKKSSVVVSTKGRAETAANQNVNLFHRTNQTMLLFVSDDTETVMATSTASKSDDANRRAAATSLKSTTEKKLRSATLAASAHRVADSALGKYKVGTPLSIVATNLRDATPMQRVTAERQGVAARLVKELANEMEIPAIRMFKIIGVPKATAERKAEKNQAISGGGGQAALGLLNLLGIAQAIVADSTDERAKTFDVAKWLGRWIENPQPALGGRKPADLLDTPTGMDVVARLLGSLQSGAYQ